MYTLIDEEDEFANLPLWMKGFLGSEDCVDYIDPLDRKRKRNEISNSINLFTISKLRNIPDR